MNEHEPLLIGIIGKAHGLKGEVCLTTYNQRTAAISIGASLLLREPDGNLREVEVVKDREINKRGRRVVQLAGVESRVEAEALSGQQVFILRDQLDEVDDQTFYYAEVIDYAVVNEENKSLGQIEHVFEGATDILVVVDESREWLIPVTREIVLKIDHPNKRFVVQLPEGLEPSKRTPEKRS